MCASHPIVPCRWPHADDVFQVGICRATTLAGDRISTTRFTMKLYKDDAKGFREALPLLFAREAALA